MASPDDLPQDANDDGRHRPGAMVVGGLVLLAVAAAGIGGVLLFLRYGIGVPLQNHATQALNAGRRMAAAADEPREDVVAEPVSETAMTILPFQPDDAGTTQPFPSPEAFAKLLSPSADELTANRENFDAGAVQPPSQTAVAVKIDEPTIVKAGDQETVKADGVASAPAQTTEVEDQAELSVDDQPDEPRATAEPPAPPPAPDYWVFGRNSQQPVIVTNRNSTAALAQLLQAGLATTQPPAPWATQPPAPWATQPPAPGLTTPPAPWANEPPAPGLTTPPAAWATAPPAPGFTTAPAPWTSTPPTAGFTTPPAPFATQPPTAGFGAPPSPWATPPPAPGLSAPFLRRTAR